MGRHYLTLFWNAHKGEGSTLKIVMPVYARGAMLDPLSSFIE